MTKEQIIAFRENAKQSGKQVFLWLDNALVFYENLRDCEAFIWDDDNEVVYIVMPNSVHTNTIDSRLYPMSILTMDYDAITFMSVAVDRLCLDNFFKDKVGKGLTNEETRKRYFKDMTDLFDDKTYLMGQPSPTTEKRGLRPDDEIVDVNATKFL